MSDAADIRIIAGNPTAEEVAAITAVITAVFTEHEELQRLAAPRTVSAWRAAQRPIRGRIIPGLSRWRGFEG